MAAQGRNAGAEAADGAPGSAGTLGQSPGSRGEGQGKQPGGSTGSHGELGGLAQGDSGESSEGPANGSAPSQDSGHGFGGKGKTGSGAAPELLDQLFQQPGEHKLDMLNGPARALRQAENDHERRDPAPTSAAERRLQDAVRRIENERQKRADAVNVWKPGGPDARRSWKDW